MKHPKHSAGFVLYHRPAHEKPRGGRGTFIRAASLFVAAACLTLSGLCSHQHVLTAEQAQQALAVH